MDPVGTTFSNDNVDVDAGIDMGAYPTPRTFTFGVRIELLTFNQIDMKTKIFLG